MISGEQSQLLTECRGRYQEEKGRRQARANCHLQCISIPSIQSLVNLCRFTDSKPVNHKDPERTEHRSLYTYADVSNH